MICWWMRIKLNTFSSFQGSPYIPVGIKEALRYPVVRLLRPNTFASPRG
jgi:hypothetical protein